jgi:hypothetical protein
MRYSGLLCDVWCGHEWSRLTFVEGGCVVERRNFSYKADVSRKVDMTRYGSPRHQHLFVVKVGYIKSQGP